ncbi:MAG: transketolase, partial [Armatimonadetes bacterium]|nr:transketolase [Armatimonadota bacterium]
MAAVKFKLGNLTVILDYNGIQQTGATADVMPTEPIADKWQAFGCTCRKSTGTTSPRYSRRWIAPTRCTPGRA